MGSYITTYTGKHFDYLAPDADMICIEDIAHALPLLCRGNGHVHNFWSVGQHCICCAREAAARNLPNRTVLACLLHDASECYMSDVPRPFKSFLPVYTENEERLLSLIYEKFLGSDLSSDEKAQLSAIDDDMLWYDLSYLLGEPQHSDKPYLHITVDYTFRPFDDIEREYLDIFRKYSALI